MLMKSTYNQPQVSISPTFYEHLFVQKCLRSFSLLTIWLCTIFGNISKNTSVLTMVNQLTFLNLDTDRSCVPIETTNPPGCVRDDECEKDSACLNRICMNPCDCGKGADCFLSNHRPVCQCPEGTVGNPQIECKPVGCQSDSECQDREACSNGKCINPCLLDDPCGVTAECYPQRHIANCRCVSGYEGDPIAGCIPIGCKSHPECPLNRACENRDCVNPCETNNPCAENLALLRQHVGSSILYPSGQCSCNFNRFIH